MAVAVVGEANNEAAAEDAGAGSAPDQHVAVPVSTPGSTPVSKLVVAKVAVGVTRLRRKTHVINISVLAEMLGSVQTRTTARGSIRSHRDNEGARLQVVK